MVADGVISTRGLGQDPYIVDELIFDVNTAYFEYHGGYEYAKSFYEEAYRCAIEEIGGEQFILSAVMHADERNKEVSERLGYDVYHYHLHVVYVPVVDKEIYFKKNNKDPELAGKHFQYDAESIANCDTADCRYYHYLCSDNRAYHNGHG
jgi:hypothetical protein